MPDTWKAGRWVATFSLTFRGRILAATYLPKLFPQYGGLTCGRSTLREIIHWHLTDWSHASDRDELSYNV